MLARISVSGVEEIFYKLVWRPSSSSPTSLLRRSRTEMFRSDNFSCLKNLGVVKTYPNLTRTQSQSSVLGE